MHLTVWKIWLFVELSALSFGISITESSAVILSGDTHHLPLCSLVLFMCCLKREFAECWRLNNNIDSRFEESRRTAKRPSSDRRDSYADERKRVATERRYDGPGRFDDGTR